MSSYRDMKSYIESFIKTGNLNDETQKNLKFHINRFIDYISYIEIEVDKVEKEDIIERRSDILDLRK